MENIAIYTTLIISIYILYIAIKNRLTICPVYHENPLDQKEQQPPIRVSQIFSSMFRDREPVPGNISLNINQKFVAPTPVDTGYIQNLLPEKI